MGVYSVNESVAINRSRDKLRASQLLARRGIGLPVTGFANSPDDTQDLLNIAGGAPVVIKLLEGTQGVGVVLAETKKAAESVVEAFRGLKANFMVQEYIKEAGGADIRCFCRWRQGGCRNEKARQGRRVSFESASRWFPRLLIKITPGREVYGRSFCESDGAQCLGSRLAAIKPWACCNGGQFKPGP